MYIDSFYALLAIYGLCFGIANKLPMLHGKHRFLDALLGCSFCLGFHCGWIVYLLSSISVASDRAWSFEHLSLIDAMLMAFVGASFCYIVDTFVQYLESRIAFMNIRS